MGAPRLPDVALDDQYFESKFVGPDNVIIDVGEHGWRGAKGLDSGPDEPRAAKIRHVAISTEHPEQTARWYQAVFNLVEAGRSPVGVYLSDGETNFAVLRLTAETEPGRVELGMSHFGFMVADPDATYRRLEAHGARRLPDVMLGGQYFEVKYQAPDGVILDVGEHGWIGAKGLPTVSAAGPTN